MLKIYSLLLIVSLSGLAFAQKAANDNRREKIVNIINEELNEVVRLSKQRDNSDPELLLRAAELNLEKARLVREVEHEKFLAIPAEQRRGVDQNQAYARSNGSFQAANQYALAVTKKFPNYKEIADVYYVLAYNARELKQYETSEKYFKLANSKARSGTPTAFKAQLALAEALYNKNEFSKAIPLYEKSLAKLNETWWTKDAFNLAWCYYRVKSYDKAITLMKEIHSKSADQRYINMRYYVERDLGIFYVDAKRSNEAIAWYKSQGIDFSGHLIKIAKVLVPQGKFTQAEQLASEAAALVKTKEARIELLFLQMDLYDKFEKSAAHLKASEELTAMSVKNELDENQNKILEYQIAKKAAELQKAASSPIYKNVKETRELRSRQAESYFALLAQLKPNKSAEPSFFKGETAYAARRYPEAIQAYDEAFNAASREGNKKIQTQALEGMLASLGQPGFSAAQAEKWYVPVYTAAIKQEPRSERSKVVRQKLYKVHLDRKNYEEAEAVMRDYAKVFPDDFKTQESMLAGLMDEARKSKNFDKIKSYVGEINAGTFRVSKKYADALRQLMTKIQIEGAQTAMDKGDKSTALSSYLRVYNNPESTPSAKANAAYNLAALYYEAGDPGESYKWGVTALQEMSVAEVKQFATSFLTIGTNLFLRQRFQQSADLSMRTVAKLCAQGLAAKNTAFKNSAFLWLAEGQFNKAEEVVALGIKCGIDESTMNEVRIELAKEHVKNKRWESLQQTIDPVARSKTQAALAIPFLDTLRQSYLRAGDGAKAQELNAQIFLIYRDSKSKNLDIPVEGLDLIAGSIIPKLEQKKLQLESMKLAFPEQQFNQTVKQKLVILDSLTADVNEVQQTGSGKGIVKAYRLLVACYEDFAKELRDFTPEGKAPEYVESFRKAMMGVWTPILETAQRRRTEVSQLIHKNSILSSDNGGLLAPQGTDLVMQYQAPGAMVLMDRGGLQ
jgi:hypothetical protein